MNLTHHGHGLSVTNQHKNQVGIMWEMANIKHRLRVLLQRALVTECVGNLSLSYDVKPVFTDLPRLFCVVNVTESGMA